LCGREQLQQETEYLKEFVAVAGYFGLPNTTEAVSTNFRKIEQWISANWSRTTTITTLGEIK
jgi:hypothetical protein